MINSTTYTRAIGQLNTELLLERPVIQNNLKRAFEKPLTTVIAGAGYGKTQAVIAALQSMECKSVWLPLSELDNHITRFWERIVKSLELYSKKLAEGLIALGFPESIATFDQFIRLITRELPKDEHFVFVFDDFHLINNKSIASFFELFVYANVKNLSIVIISRIKPAFNSVSMMYKGVHTRVTEEDLRFSKEEMEDYFRKINVKFDDKESACIYAQTDGWAFAIYLAGLSLKNECASNKNRFYTEAKFDIFELIENEIFKAVSECTQQFFIAVSVLDRLPTALINELSGENNILIFEEMAHFSHLIRYDASSDSYGFHHLFKEFLKEKRIYLPSDKINETYMKAADWYNRMNCKVEALTYYKECGCYNEIFDIILSFTHQVVKNTADLFINLIEHAPSSFIKNKPIMRNVRANFLFNNNRIEEARNELMKICDEYGKLPQSQEHSRLLGEAYITLGLINIVNHDYSFIECFKKARELLPNGSILFDHKLNIAEGLNACSIKSPLPGELKRHQDALFEVAKYATKVMNGCGYGLEILNAAESYLYLGDIKNAEKYAYQAIYMSKQYNQYDVEFMAIFVLVRIFTATGKYNEVKKLLSQMKNKLETIQTAYCISLNDVISGWFYVKIGKTDKVAKWIRHEDETRKILAPVHLGREYFVRSDCLLVENRFYELLAFMEHTDIIYEERGILYAVIQNHITRALIYHQIGDTELSMKYLHNAYDLANPNNLIMLFIEYGNKMRTLIHSARMSNECRISMEWLNMIYTKTSTYAKRLSQVVSDYNSDHSLHNKGKNLLSKRETEVLLYLFQGLTRAEIAANCYLSLSTINSIVRNIYNKLGAFNIVDAIRIAQERGVI